MSQMSDLMSELTEELGDPLASVPVPPARFEQFAPIVPPLLLELWQHYGFAGFHEGRIWLCDPVEWAPVVAAWTANLDLAMGEDTWHAVTRGPFGDMNLWGERTGMSLSIEPVHGMIFPHEGRPDRMNGDRNRDIQVFVTLSTSDDSGDLYGSDEKPLFKRALKAHGPVGPSTMYTFVPAYALGGPLDTKHIEIADAVTHVELLAQLSPHRTMGDITRS